MELPNLSLLEKLGPIDLNKLFIGILAASLFIGSGTGYVLAQRSSQGGTPITPLEQPKSASQDSRTFRDFAEGTIMARPVSKNPNEYSEGTHILAREGAVPVALTSSVVDLSEYEGKKVRVLGETQKAIKEGWLMDVGKVEVKN